MHRCFLAVLVLILGGVSRAGAVTVLSTGFDGRTVAGSTASNLTWVTNGIANPGDLTAATNPDGLFDTPNAQNRFAVDRNLHNEGSWSVDISLAVGAAAISLNSVNLDALIFNNSGVLQGVSRDLDMTAELLDAGLSSIDSDTILDIYPGSGTPVQPQNITFDLSGNILSANTTYVLRLTALGQGPGNNSGMDNLIVDGDLLKRAVPEPTTAAMALLGLAGVAMRRRRA